MNTLPQVGQRGCTALEGRGVRSPLNSTVRDMFVMIKSIDVSIHFVGVCFSAGALMGIAGLNHLPHCARACHDFLASQIPLARELCT